MSDPHFSIRDEAASDAPAVDTVLSRAFGGRSEAELVAALRREGYFVVSLVATVDHVVVGYMLLGRLRVERASNGIPGLALAPLAVVPEFQRHGIGAALVRAGLQQAKSMGESIVFVLGDPAYYGRFGFSAEAAKGFDCVYAGEAFQALALGSYLPARMTGKVVYPQPFDALGA